MSSITRTQKMDSRAESCRSCPERPASIINSALRILTNLPLCRQAHSRNDQWCLPCGFTRSGHRACPACGIRCWRARQPPTQRIKHALASRVTTTGRLVRKGSFETKASAAPRRRSAPRVGKTKTSSTRAWIAWRVGGSRQATGMQSRASSRRMATTSAVDPTASGMRRVFSRGDCLFLSPRRQRGRHAIHENDGGRGNLVQCDPLVGGVCLCD